MPPAASSGILSVTLNCQVPHAALHQHRQKISKWLGDDQRVGLITTAFHLIIKLPDCTGKRRNHARPLSRGISLVEHYEITHFFAGGNPCLNLVATGNRSPITSTGTGPTPSLHDQASTQLHAPAMDNAFPDSAPTSGDIIHDVAKKLPYDLSQAQHAVQKVHVFQQSHKARIQE